MKELQMGRNIHDGMHGLIPFTKEEIEIVDHPLFQRMRWICQTGLLKFICPTATHSRFEHSLGTVYTAQKMFDALYEQSKIISDKLYGAVEAERGQAIRFYELPQELRTSMQRVLRLSALVHDLGHGPLSHVFASFMPKAASMEALFDDPRLAAIAPLKAELLRGKNERLEHEAMSCLLFAVIWHDLRGESWVPRAIAAVLLGIDVSIMDPALRSLLPLMRDMVSSAPVDADRMDYLLRDSRETGVCYGLYETHRVLKSILCLRGQDLSFRLGWRDSGLAAIESFAIARYQMFAQIYQQKTLRATELMLHAIRREAESEEGALIRTGTLDEFLEDFGDMSDEMFLRTLCGKIRPDFPRKERIAALAGQIMARKLWKRVYEFHEDDDPDTFALAMRKRHPDLGFILDRQPLKAMKDLDRGARLLSFDERRKYSVLPKERSWLEASSLLRVFKDKELSLVRLYLEVNDDHGLAKAIKEEAFRLASLRTFSR